MKNEFFVQNFGQGIVDYLVNNPVFHCCLADMALLWVSDIKLIVMRMGVLEGF